MEDIAVAWDVAGIAEAVVGLPAPGPLSRRTVLVPGVRVAHALRREVERTGARAAQAGTTFFTPLAFAASVLEAGAAAARPENRRLRVARLRRLSERRLELPELGARRLRDVPGWDEALVRAIEELEAAGLRPLDLQEREAEGLLADVLAAWRALEEAPGAGASPAALLTAAAERLEAGQANELAGDATLAVVSGSEPAAVARLVEAIPNARLCLLAGRPRRTRYLERVEALYGRVAPESARRAAPPRRSESERDLLGSYLFEEPALLSDPKRRRSDGPDGTVELEEHGGTGEELAAAVEWVGARISAGTPLAEIALLLPALDPVAGSLVERLRELSVEGESLPVYVAGGLPLSSTAGGARVLAILRALEGWLGAEDVAGVLPHLRPAEGTERPPRGRARELVYRLGTPGGTPAHPKGALDWTPRLAAREEALAHRLRALREGGGAEEEADERARASLERALSSLRAVRPGLDALSALADAVLDEEPLPDLAGAVLEFLKTWLILPGEGAAVPALLERALEPLASDATCSELAGTEALALILETARSERIAVGRFGEPAVYVGAVEGAIGLSFRDVRVLGLSEGRLPAPPRQDPILSDDLRERLGPRVGRAGDRVIAGLHALDWTVRQARGTVVLSCPRLGPDRVIREPSSVLLEAQMALGRPDRQTGERPPVPDSRALRRDGFQPGREAARRRRHETPLGAGAWLDRMAAGLRELPRSWRGRPILDLERIEELLSTDDRLHPLPAEGVPDEAMPGLTPARPVSAYRLRKLLECPHRFLLEDLLGLDEPPAPPLLREIDALTYGSLFHRVAERFARAHGAPFGARERSLEAWLEEANAILKQTFEEFLEEYPLVGGAVKVQERARLAADVHDLLRYDWNQGKRRRFVDAERAFGFDAPLALQAGGDTLHVRGYIDRLDVEAGATLVRDLKTGKPRPRRDEGDFDPVVDMQIALYGRVARELADTWELPPRVEAAYVYPRGHGKHERSFRDDYEDLEAAAASWLSLCAGLLRGRYFPRTPREDDCRFCPHEPVCGEGAQARSGERLAGEDIEALQAFLALKEES